MLKLNYIGNALFAVGALCVLSANTPTYAQAAADMNIGSFFSNSSPGYGNQGAPTISGAYTDSSANANGVSGAYTSPNYTNPNGISAAYTNQNGISPAYSQSGYAIPDYVNPDALTPIYDMSLPGGISSAYSDPRFAYQGGTSSAYSNPGASLSVPLAFARAQAGGVARDRRGLPPTSLDSFVLNAGGMSEMIYGDEGAGGLPPYFGFDQGHRINTGIVGQRAAGLTTGHASALPEAWGWPE